MRVAMLALWGLWLALAAPAGAAPVLDVRSRLRLELEGVDRVPGGVLIRGRLEDAASGEPVARRTVALSIQGQGGPYHYAEPTAEDGSFRWRVAMPLGDYVLHVAARGDDTYAPPPPVERAFDVSKRTPRLSLAGAAQVSVERPSLRLTARVEDDGGHPARLPLGLSLGGATLAEPRVGDEAVTLELDPRRLGRPGDEAELVLRFAGDDERNPAEARHRVRLTTPTRLTLAADGATVARDGELTLGGTLTDAGGPVAGAAVELHPSGGEGAPLLVGRTDAVGRYRVVLRPRALADGPLFLEARHAPEVSWREPSRSTVVALQVLPAEGPRAAFYLTPLATLLLAAGLVARRRLREAGRRRKARNGGPAARPAAGVEQARPSLLRQLRPATARSLGGVVRDQESGRPIPGARVEASSGEGLEVGVADGDGRFSFTALPAGDLAVTVRAAGFLPERFRARLPHRGELDELVVRLASIRSRVFAVYRAAAERLVPRPQLAAVWTPREVERHAAATRLLPEDVRALAALVEEACFGPTPPDEAAVARAEALAARIAAPGPPEARA